MAQYNFPSAKETEYTQFSLVGTVGSFSLVTYTLANISGEGYFDIAAGIPVATGVNFAMRITIDGILVYSASKVSPATSTLFGVVSAGFINMTTFAAFGLPFKSAAALASASRQATVYPYTSNGDLFSIVGSRVNFKNSLLVVVDVEAGASSGNVTYSILGGLKV